MWHTVNKPVKTASSSVKVDVSGAPVQTHAQGLCKCPGCPYGRRLDTTTGAVLDYCSKSCARKDSARQTQMTSSGSSLPLQASLDPGTYSAKLIRDKNNNKTNNNLVLLELLPMCFLIQWPVR